MMLTRERETKKETYRFNKESYYLHLAMYVLGGIEEMTQGERRTCYFDISGDNDGS